MDVHANAKLGPAGRFACTEAIAGGMTQKAAATAFCVIQFSAMVAGGIAGNPVITLVGAIVIGVPATFVQALLRHAWKERRRRRRDAAAARAGTARGSVYDAPSTRRT